MLFTTICVLSSALSLRNSLNNSSIKYAPRDIEISKRYNPDGDVYGYSEEQKKDSLLTINESLAKLNFNYHKYFTNITDFTLYI